MKFKNLLINWKTSSAGLLLIIGGLVRLSFMIAQGAATEEGVMTVIASMLSGVGFLVTRDATVTSVEMGLQDVEKKTEATKVVTPKGKK